MGAGIPGLRERKKQRTRSTLIDAAVELCDKQGFDNTTVDQIAAVADVSPRTFSRYFATKDAVILALIDDMTAAIAVQLARQPAELSPLDAMFGAHIAMIKATASVTSDGFTTERLKTITRIVNSSPGAAVGRRRLPRPRGDAAARRTNGRRVRRQEAAAGDRRLRDDPAECDRRARRGHQLVAGGRRRAGRCSHDDL